MPSHSVYVNIEVYITITLPVAVYRYRTWSLSLREGHRLRFIQQRVEYLNQRGEITARWKSDIVRSFVIHVLIKYC
jgi:hypothetical protein